LINDFKKISSAAVTLPGDSLSGERSAGLRRPAVWGLLSRKKP